ncbi:MULTISPECIES: MFS transporter [Pseudomonas]|uniref:MFS transporter n=1 Tax=Pseudomonas TaxID=286 RepID=UPI00028EF10C|nr:MULTISPECIES: MFS transporter [Pseudomonas]EKG37734.1 hypothetical protein Pav037_2730 [Pseudomonas syringae pv. avellanae str. ISPaVe037]POP71764.1 MFS transporter [Pseudomonas syringae]
MSRPPVIAASLMRVHRHCAQELLGTLLIRLVYFIAYPYMVIIFEQQFSLNQLESGALLFTATLSAFFATQLAGNAIDAGNLRTALVVSSLVLASAIAMLMTLKLTVVVIGLMGLTISTRTLEMGFKVNLSDRAPNEVIEMAHSARYYYVNIGGAIAPALVALAGIHNRDVLLYGCLACAFIITLYACLNVFPGIKKKQRIALTAGLQVIFQDKTFLALCAFCVLCYLVIHSNDIVLLMLLNSQFPPTHAIQLYATLQIINTVMVVFMYFSINQALQRLTLRQRIFLALSLLIVSQVIVFSCSLDSYAALLPYAILLKLGELIVISTTNFTMELLTPVRYKGAYFSFFYIYMLGMACAPLLGGLFVYADHGNLYFLLLSGFLIGCFYIFNQVCASGRLADSGACYDPPSH